MQDELQGLQECLWDMRIVQAHWVLPCDGKVGADPPRVRHPHRGPRARVHRLHFD